jgi:hypothetical protein
VLAIIGCDIWLTRSLPLPRLASPVSTSAVETDGEVDLEAGDAGQRAGGRADLGREVGQRREVVSDEGRLAREPAACQLHPVAGVPGEPDRHLFELNCSRRR